METDTTIRFKVGQVYTTRSACDHDCVYDFQILERTEKSVKIEVWGVFKRRKISGHNGVEQFLPHGRHSMCAIVRADRRA